MTKLGKRRTIASGFLMRTTALWCSAALVTVPFISQAAMAADYTGTNGGRGGDAQWSDSGTQAGGAGGGGGTNGSGGTAAAGGGAGGAATGYMGGSGGAADGGGGGGVYNGAGRPGGGGGAGGAGYILSDGNSFTSSGNVTGGQGGDGGYSATSFGQFSYAQAGGGGGGGGGSGIIASGTATITNTNNITGGTGGAGQYSNYNVFNRGDVFADNGYNGAGGHGISAIGATSLTINNSGNITGGNAGYLLYGEPNSGGSGIYGQNITLYNTGGTIKGGIGTLDYAPGIRLTGGANTLNISGGTVTGYQNGDAIRADNGTNIFNVSGGTVAADAGGIGLDIAAGNNTLTLSSGSISLNQSSTGLQVGGGTNTFNVTGGSFSQSSIYYNTAIVVNAGTNIFNASAGNILGGFQSNAVKLNNGTNTFNISGSANFNSGYVGDVFVIGGGINTLNISGGTVTPSQYGTYGINVSGGTNILNVTGGTVGRIYLGGGTNTLEGGGFSSDVTLASSATAKVITAATDVAGIGSFDNYGALTIESGRSISMSSFTNENGATLTLNANAQLISSNLNLVAGSTITGAGSLSSGSAAYSLDSGSISTALAGTGGLTKTGTGTLTLTGANTYTGGTNIEGGTLSVAFGALGGGDVHMAEGTTIQFTGGSFTTSNSFFINGDPVFDVASGTQTINSVIADDTSAAPPVPGVVEKTGAGELVLSGANTYSGGTIISAGTLTVGVDSVRDSNFALVSSAIGLGTVTLDGGTLTNNASGGAFYTLYNDVQVTANGGTIDGGTRPFQIFGNITDSGAPGTLTIAGSPGGTVFFGGTNTYSAATVISSGGQLTINNSTALSANSDFTVNGTLQINGSASGTIKSLSGTGTVTNLQAGSPVLTIATGAAQTATFDGTISDFGGGNPHIGIAIHGAGTQKFTQANSYSGGTTLTAGTLEIGNAGALGGGTVTFDGGTLKTDGAYGIGNAIHVGAGGGTLDNNANDINLSGNITDSGTPGVLALTGSGRTSLTGDNSGFSGGISVTSGTLGLNGPGGGDITVHGGTVAFDAAGSYANNVKLDTAATFLVSQFTSDRVILNGVISDLSGSAALALTGNAPGAVVELAGANTYTGGTTLDGGIIARIGVDTVGTPGHITSGALGTGTVTVTSGSFMAGGDYTLANDIALSASSAVDANGHAFTFSGLISGTGGLTLVDGVGGGSITMANASNSFLSGVIVDNLTVILGGSSGTGTGPLGTGPVTLDGGTLRADASGHLDNAMYLDSHGGTLRATSGTYAFGPLVDVSSPAHLTIGAAGDMGIVSLADGSSYSGGTTIAGGTALANGATPFGDATTTVVVQQGATLAYADQAAIANPLQFAGNITLGVASGSAEQQGDIGDDGPATAYTVTKTGAGTLALTGTNTSSANIRLSAGVLEIGDQNALGGGTYIFDGGTLKFDGDYLVHNDIEVDNGGGTLNVNSHNVTFEGTLSEAAGSTGYLSVSGGGSVTITGTNNLTGGAAINTGGILTVANGLALGGGDVVMAHGSTIAFTTGDSEFSNRFMLDGDPAFDVATGITTTLTGVIADAPSPAAPGVLEKTGTGTLVLAAANTYSGGTTLTDGILQVGVDTVGTPGSITSSAIGTGALTFDGGTLQAGGDYTLANAISLASADGAVDANGHAFALSGLISGNHGLTFSDSQGGGTIAVSGASTYSGDTHINGTTVILQAGSSGPSTGPLGAGTIVLDGGTLQAGISGFLVTPIALDTNGGTLRAGGNSYQFGPISDGGTPGALTIGAAGDTGTVVLAAGSTYTGGTTVAGGVARVTGSDSFGDTSGFVTVNAGATVQYDDTVDIANTLILHGAAILNVATSTDVATQSGDILEDVPSSLEKTGAGTLVLSSSSGNNYSGATIVSEGTLQVSSFAALPGSSDVEVASGATLAIDGGIAFGVEIGSLGDHAGAGGTVTIGSGTELFVGDGSNANNTTFSGTVTGGDLTYDGAGTLTLTGAGNSVEALTICGCVTTGGITLSGGHMDATYRVDVESGTLTVQNGAVLEVSGTGFASTGGAVLVTGAGSAVIVHTAVPANNDTAVTNFFSASAASQTIAAGGSFTTPGDSYIATDGTPGATATGLVTGAGSVWTADHFLVGSGFLGGNGALTVADGGKVVSTGGISLALGSTLSIGNGGLAGIIDAPTISGGGSNKIVADFTDTGTLSAQIGGGLSLTKQGSGTLILTGANTNSGLTTISGGTLQVGDGGAAGALGTGAVTDNGTLVFNTSTPAILASIVNGSGKLMQQGSGALTLTAGDGYTGETGIAANATLKLTGSGAIQSSRIVTDNGVLDISGAPSGSAIQTLAGNGSVLLGNKSLTFLNGSTTFSGSITDGGAGGSVLFQGGSQVLTGTNSWTGTTTIAAGATVTVASPASLGGSSITFFNGSVLKFAGGGTYALPAEFAQVHAPVYDVGANTVTWSGQITGVGDLAVTGNGGTLVLTNAANSYGGGTEVTGGAALKVDADGELGATATALQLGDATTAGTLRFGGSFNLNAARTIVLGAGGGVIDTNGNATTISQALTGGALVVTGNGALTLTGANSYAGGTDVHGGATLVANADSALGTAGLKLGDATTAGTLRFGGSFNLSAARTIVLGAGGGVIDTNGNATTISQALTGGALVVTGNGALTLTGANSYAGGTDVHGGAALVANADGALGAGGLKLGDATTAGTLRFGGAFTLNHAITLGAGGGVIDTNGNTGTIASAITGGGLTKTGAGNLILTGAGTFTGPAAINGGTLSVNGTVTSGVTVNSGGTLGGTGTVGATTVASGGTIAPGNSIGTLHVNGNLTLASGSVTAIELSPSAADQIAVSGTAALGGTLAFNQGAGSYVAGTDLKLVTASSVNGVFSNVTGLSVTGLDANVTYSATAVDLVLTTPAASGGSGDSGGGGSSGGGNSGGGNSGGGSGGGTVTSSFLFDTYGKTPNQIAAGKALAAGANTGTLYVATGNVVAANLAAVPATLGQLAGDIHAGIRGAAIEDSRIIRNAVLGRLDRDGEGAAVWGSAFGGYGSIAGDGNAAALHHDSAGLIAGADMPLSDGIRVGIAAAYSTDQASTSGHLSTASGNNGHIIGYAGWTGGAFDLKLGGDYGWGTVHTARQVAVLGQTLAGRQDQTMGQVFADAGYRIVTTDAMLEPYVDIAHVAITSGSFAERGGSAALSGGSATDGLTYGTLGLRAALALDQIGIVPKLDLGWRHAFDTLKPGQLVSFQDTGTSFTVLGVPLGTDAAALQLGFDVVLTPDARLTLGYDGTFGSRAQNNAVRGAFQWAF